MTLWFTRTICIPVLLHLLVLDAIEKKLNITPEEYLDDIDTPNILDDIERYRV